ncbi:site-2 protease family protein [Bacillus sp. R86525]|uniref:site-2 protease family protein n=1 Tax=Bacillus sp. R86525 TaxID=3101709 RepID=UPI003670C7EA
MKIVILLIATIVHELGHVIGAKLVGIRIKEVGIGFGPTIFKFTQKNVTYKVSWIILGGYVIPEKHGEDFYEYSTTSRVILTASGLIMSILVLPLLCMFIIHAMQGNLSNIFIDLEKMLNPFYSHPLQYVYHGIESFPTLIYSNNFLSGLACLAEISFFLGIINAIPIPPLDGGSLLLEIIEKVYPNVRINQTRWISIGYLIIFLCISMPILIVLVQRIKETFPIFIIGTFLVFYIVKRWRVL